MQWFDSLVVFHSFADNSGTVFFHFQTGETLALTITLSSIIKQLSEPDSILRLDQTVMPRLKTYLSNAAIRQLGLSNDI